MTTFTVGKDGRERVHTTVAVDRILRDYARDNEISLSKTLEMSLERLRAKPAGGL